jgi:hypothetical protein
MSSFASEIETKDSFEWMKTPEQYYGKLPKNVNKEMLVCIMARGLNNVVQHALSLDIDDFAYDATSLMDLLDKWFEHDSIRTVEHGGHQFHYLIRDEEIDDFFDKVKKHLITVYDFDEDIFDEKIKTPEVKKITLESWMKTPEKYYGHKFPRYIEEDELVDITSQILYNLFRHAIHNGHIYNADNLLDILMLWCKEDKYKFFKGFSSNGEYNYKLFESVRESLVNIDPLLDI